jgi:hypothetical protein
MSKNIEENLLDQLKTINLNDEEKINEELKT